MKYPIFTFGAPASRCKTGKNPKYPGKFDRLKCNKFVILSVFFTFVILGLCNPNEDFSQHENGDWYFDNKAQQSPVVKEWLKNGKRMNL